MAYSSITKPSDYFRTKLYTGNGSNDRAITFDESTNMQPDWLWIKSRGTGQSHAIFDAVRGANKRLVTNSSGAETTENTNLDSFDTNGFTIDNEAIVNENGIGYASWNWKANGAGSANNDGSITSTVSVNTTAGFSIVKWTGTGANATVGHGLGAVPKMIITKSIASSNWGVYHESLGNTDAVFLNETTATGSSSNYWNNTSPTSSVFYLGNGGTNGGSTNNTGGMIAYCFAEKKGYSKFGSYTGNGNADGTFVYTGFKPAWIMTKMSSGVQTWNIFDNRRNGYNPTERNLQANLNNAEDTGRDLDILSNGFKQRNGGAEGNGNNSTYIYMAFAAEPLVANVGQSIPATAR